jgi:hypothetical protein
MAPAPLAKRVDFDSSTDYAAGTAEEWTITLSGQASQELARIMDLTGHSIERLVAISISLLGIVADARHEGKLVFLATRSGRLLRQIFIPERAS